MAIPFAVPPVVAVARSAAALPEPGALRGGALHEPKWDGFRAVLVVDEGAATIWSRQTTAFPEVAVAAAAQIPDGCVAIGATAGSSLWSTASRVRRGLDEEEAASSRSLFLILYFVFIFTAIAAPVAAGSSNAVMY